MSIQNRKRLRRPRNGAARRGNPTEASRWMKLADKGRKPATDEQSDYEAQRDNLRARLEAVIQRLEAEDAEEDLAQQERARAEEERISAAWREIEEARRNLGLTNT